MNARVLGRVMLCALLLGSVGNAGLWAQKAPVPSRVVDQIDDSRTVKLTGNVHPLARPAYD